MSKLPQLKEKARGLEAKDPKAAIEAWVEVLKGEEAEGVGNPDLSIYNRIGDLSLKLKDPAQAADYYDRAVDKYAELGFHNNAIAMCNKVLRNAPGRQTTYLKLAKLYAAKGFIAEAKQNFVVYAERMQKIGKIQQAFSALKEFTDISAGGEHLRQMLEEHLKVYGDVPHRRSTTRLGTPPAQPPSAQGVGATGKRKTSSLIFLDLNEPPRKSKPGMKAPPAPPAATPPPPAAAAETLIQEPTPEPDTSLEIETTSLAEGVETGGAAAGGALEGLEATHTDFDEVQAAASPAPSLREELPTEDIEPIPELETTVPPEAEEAPPSPPPRVVIPKPAGPPKVRPVVPKRPAAPPPPQRTPAPEAPPPKRKTVVEMPPLELEPDFETATTEAGHEVDDQPLAVDESQPALGWIETEDDTSITPGRKSGFVELGVDELVGQDDQATSLIFTDIETAPAGPSIEELEERVADNPDDPEAHQALGEALIEAGERDRGIEELDFATAGFENADNLQQAQGLVDEILRLDPNSVRHRQKQVEFAFKSGDKAKLIDAYLELADSLLRGDLPEKAQAVYERVVEHDPTNERAKAALAMLAPVAPSPPEEERRVAAKDAKMTVRDEAATDGDFVDLGALILEEETPARDSRMKVEEEEPTGDEEQDFQEMLARFRQGIEENIDEADFQSHYDLGVAFKEMGLLDEAIAEFQKALRAPEGKLRTSEALGGCFFEKGAFVVAESILRRGLELPAGGDQERLGVLYWLARALEEQGKKAEARDLYGRVGALDIRFRDVAERVKTLAKAK